MGFWVRWPPKKERGHDNQRASQGRFASLACARYWALARDRGWGCAGCVSWGERSGRLGEDSENDGCYGATDASSGLQLNQSETQRTLPMIVGNPDETTFREWRAPQSAS